MRLFAVAAPGLEAVVARECAALPGARDVRQIAGGVEWETDAAGVLEANLRLRVASRVLVRVGQFKARDFARLVREAAALPWEQFAAARGPVDVTATAKKSRLYHTGAIAERVQEAVADRLSCRPVRADAPSLGVLARVEDDAFTLSVDASGELLHKRGYREETAKAPLRETLAAGLLVLAGWDPAREPLVDPMCGSGTIVLEAARIALGRVPDRSFACETWPLLAEAGVDVARRKAAAQAARDTLAHPILGSDRDAGAVEIARRNAVRAALDTHVTFACADAATAPIADTPGLIIVNAPYGMRIDLDRERPAYAALASLWKRARGWRLAVLTSDPALLRPLGARPMAEHRLDNGGLRVRLSLFGPSR